MYVCYIKYDIKDIYNNIILISGNSDGINFNYYLNYILFNSYLINYFIGINY